MTGRMGLGLLAVSLVQVMPLVARASSARDNNNRAPIFIAIAASSSASGGGSSRTSSPTWASVPLLI